MSILEQQIAQGAISRIQMNSNGATAQRDWKKLKAIQDKLYEALDVVSDIIEEETGDFPE